MSGTILVTGGAGYIGSACVQRLVEQGYQVAVFDDLSTGQRDMLSGEVTFIEGDITDREAVRAACGSAPFDAVIHLAAKKAVGESEENPSRYFQTNVVGSAHVLSAMEEHNIPTLVFSSTAVVYASPTDNTPLTEESPLCPSSVYGTTKKLVEEMIASYVRTTRLTRGVSLRYFNVAGDAGLGFQERNTQNVFPALASATQQGASFSIFGTDYPTADGTCIRDYIHLEDLVDAHLRALTAPSGSYNLGTSKGYSVRELVATFAAASGQPLPAHELPRRPGDLPILIASAEKAQRELGWSATRSLEEMVSSTLRAWSAGE